MGDGNDNIFAAGASGPAGNAASSDAKPAITDRGIEGRIDPATARAFSVDGDTGSTGDSAGRPADNPSGQSTDAPRRRGRPPGSKNSGTGKEEARSIRASFIEKTLYSIHLALSSIAKAPEFELEADDAAKLGEAIANVMKYYKVTMTPKQEAWGILIEAAAEVYPPMIVSLYVRRMAEAKKAKAGQPPQQPRPQAPPRPTNGAVNAPFDTTNIRIPE